MRSRLIFPILGTMLALGFWSVRAEGQASMTIKNAIENQGLTGFAVRQIPEDFDATDREWLQLMADDPTVQQAMRDSIVASLRDRLLTRQRFDATIAWQNWLGRIVFVVVHVPLCLGLYFAWREFRAAEQVRDRPRSQEGTTTEIELGLQRVALKSSLHGMAMLTIAAAMYLAFLVLVYPIVVL